MRKLYSFVRSMKFGIIILLVVVGFSVVGSLIPQTFDDTWYLENYPNFGETLLALGLHRIFSQWYFIVVCVLLGLSLATATIARLIALREILPETLVVSEDGYRFDELDEVKVSRLRGYLQKKRYRELNTGEATVYYKNRAGYFGSAVVHCSLLLILVFGGAILTLNYTEDVILLPGETATLEDGSTLQLFSFTREDPVTGRTESISVIEAVTVEGHSSGIREIRVNQPLRFNSYVYYQFQHFYAGSITATDIETGASDDFLMTERSFLTVDGRTGIWFETVFQGWRLDDETGAIIPLIYDAPIFPDPLYYYMLMDEEGHEHRYAVPGSHVYVGDIRFDFNEMAHYPLIRVSYSPHPFPSLLIGAAVMLLIGLALSFYFTPSVVVLAGSRYKITSLASQGIEMEIVAMLYEGEDIPKEAVGNLATEHGRGEPAKGRYEPYDKDSGRSSSTEYGRGEPVEGQYEPYDKDSEHSTTTKNGRGESVEGQYEPYDKNSVHFSSTEHVESLTIKNEEDESIRQQDESPSNDLRRSLSTEPIENLATKKEEDKATTGSRKSGREVEL